MSKKMTVLIVAACAAPLVTSPASAVDLTSSISNANMDTSGNKGATFTTDGQESYTSPNLGDGWRMWADESNGGTNVLWNPDTDGSSTGFFDYGWGGLDGQGSATGGVLVVRTHNYDYNGSGGTDSYGNPHFRATDTSNGYGDPTGAVADWRTDSGGVWDAGTTTWSGGVRNFEAAVQTISEAFDPTARYKLEVAVGRMANGLTDATSSLHLGGNRWPNPAPATWNGYEVSLMAGGVEGGGTGKFEGWGYGSSNPLDADYIGTIASDSTQQAGMSADTWGQSVVEYIPGVSPDASALSGKDLVISLAVPESGDHAETHFAAFDAVRLTKIMAGDANEDDLVNGTDLALLAGVFGTSGQTWATGDFNGDGTVNGTDLALLAGNFGFDGTSSAAPAGISLEEAYAAIGVVPEPTSLALLAFGGLMLGRRRR